MENSANTSKQDLVVTYWDNGDFKAATLNGEKITEDDLFKICGITSQGGFRLEYYLDKLDRNVYNVKEYEKTR